MDQNEKDAWLEVRQHQEAIRDGAPYDTAEEFMCLDIGRMVLKEAISQETHDKMIDRIRKSPPDDLDGFDDSLPLPGAWTFEDEHVYDNPRSYNAERKIEWIDEQLKEN